MFSIIKKTLNHLKIKDMTWDSQISFSFQYFAYILKEKFDCEGPNGWEGAETSPIKSHIYLQQHIFHIFLHHCQNEPFLVHNLTFVQDHWSPRNHEQTNSHSVELSWRSIETYAGFLEIFLRKLSSDWTWKVSIYGNCPIAIFWAESFSFLHANIRNRIDQTCGGVNVILLCDTAWKAAHARCR